MTGSFLPEYKEIPVRGGYLASYRLFDSQPYRFIPGKEVFATAGQAITAAKDYVRARLNTTIQSESMDLETELSEFDAWKRAKAENEKAERDKVFGKTGPRVVRNCAGGEVIVERKRARA